MTVTLVHGVRLLQNYWLNLAVDHRPHRHRARLDDDAEWPRRRRA